MAIWGMLAQTAVLFAFDLAASRTKARWMVLHALANGLVCLYSASDALHAVEDPLACCVGRPSSDVPANMIVALHAYHLLAFECTRDDWIHHLIFVAFFMCGLPGGIDYVMLVACKHSLISREAEKSWNSRINVWIRSPGLMLSAFCIYQATRHGPATTSCANHPTIAFVIGALCFVNGQYYMQRVTGNAYRKVQHFSS